MSSLSADDSDMSVLVPSKALQVLAQNLRTLMEADGSQYGTAKAIATKATAMGRKLSYKTVERTVAMSSEPSLNTVEAIAKVFGLHTWQILLPNLQPGERPEIERKVVVEA